MTALLELRGVQARYGPVQALRDVTLTVEEGEVVAVLGANGAGKTTTLRAISGTVSRTGGIELEGKQLKGGPEAAARAGIAHVPEGRGTFVDLTVTENHRLGAYTRRDRSVKDVCREHQISDTLYYSWRDRLLEGGREALAGKDERNGEKELRRKIRELERALGRKTYELEIAGEALRGWE